MGHVCDGDGDAGGGGLSMCRTSGDGQRQLSPKISDMKGAKAAVVGESGVGRFWRHVSCVETETGATGSRARARSREVVACVVEGGREMGMTVMPSRSTVRDVDGIAGVKSKGLAP